MDNVKYCSWCRTPIEKGYGYISTNNGEDFCSYDCFNDYAWDYFEAEEAEENKYNEEY